ncbi:TetR/AcrR family transcriptional regulator [Nocardia carnea]|uniref:TetR/AcrR family transcriptional regulator n=1 Tax=Nocardia carnea TaxID=37328 RepID=UPI0024569D03|nr:TetR/AcrR family transcriptional regulator [Nocardia carnea]
MPARKHSRNDVIRAALGLLDDEGLDAVSVREVARRMGVNVNTVSFQVGTKARLLGLMSDAVLAELSLENLPEDGIERAKEVLARYRRVLLAHRDGARLTAGNAPLEKHTMMLAETLVAALTEAGIPDGESIKTMWAMFYFMLGLTQEQQAVGSGAVDIERGLSSGDYPTLQRLGRDVVDLDFDERFEFGIDVLTTPLLARTRHAPVAAGNGSPDGGRVS